jgi:transposase
MFLPAHTKVFLALGYTDMRKSIDSLAVLVEYTLGMSPLSGHLFVFCNRRRTLIKILYWDRKGFCLYAGFGIKAIMPISELCRVQFPLIRCN